MRIRRVILVVYSALALMVGTFLSVSSALALSNGTHTVGTNYHGHIVQAWNVSAGRESIHGFTDHETASYMHASVDYRSSNWSLCSWYDTDTHVDCDATEEITYMKSHHFGADISDHWMD